jgi:predicted porin
MRRLPAHDFGAARRAVRIAEDRGVSAEARACRAATQGPARKSRKRARVTRRASCIRRLLLCAGVGGAGWLFGVALAVAQDASVVTLYGVLDTSLEVTNPGSGWTPRLDSGAYRGSRVGLRGSEQLSADTYLVFTLENGFSTTDGTLQTPGVLFNRQAWIGTRSTWGEVRVGRQYSPLYIPFKGDLDAFGAGTIASGLNNLSKITPYTNNALTYLSPLIGGFDATIMMATRDPSENDGNGSDGYFVTAAYQIDALRLLYARQQTHGAGALRANLGGATYAIERVRVWLAFFNGDGGTPLYHGEGGSLSAQYTFSPYARASVGYAHVRDLTGSGASADQFSAAFEYDMSRTLLFYFSAAYLANHDDATFTLRGVNVIGLPVAYPGAPVKGMQLGLIQRF